MSTDAVCRLYLKQRGIIRRRHCRIITTELFRGQVKFDVAVVTECLEMMAVVEGYGVYGRG